MKRERVQTERAEGRETSGGQREAGAAVEMGRAERTKERNF